MKGRGHLLYRAILSHLFVALPPAIALGYFVVDANRQTLLVDAQGLNLVVAEQVRDGLVADIDRHVSTLGEVERILSASELSLERRRLLVRAIVASGRVFEIGLYDPDGVLDSRVGAEDRSSIIPEALASSTITRAKVEAYTVETSAHGKRWAWLAVALLDDGLVRGFVVAPLDLDAIAARAERLRDRHLGDKGRLDVVDTQKRTLVSQTVERGRVQRVGTPFDGIEPRAGEGAFTSFVTGFSSRFRADDGARLSAVISTPALGWIVGASQPEHVALQSIDAVRMRVMLLAIVSALLAGFAALWLARHVTEPIRQLAIAVRRRARAGFNEPIEVGATAEVAVLRDAFNDAMTQLDQHRRELKRTTQLRLRMARFLPPTALHDLFTHEYRVHESGRDEDVALIYVDLARMTAGTDEVDHVYLVTVLSELFESACSEVERCGGQVDHFSGDAVIGIFTARPGGAHVHAALRAAEETIAASHTIALRYANKINGSALPVSVGLAAGRGVVGRVEGAEDVSVVGDLVADVARLHADAGPDEVRCNPLAEEILSARETRELP